jgi:class 3 adenylate cyclase/tetratricopeptide (TPR) repeat protein
MYCAKCGRRYGSSIKVCATCGDALQSKTLKRKASVHSEIRRPERRPLTGLFCDLVNSVGLSLELDAEEMMQVIDAYHKLCDEIVADHGGYLESFMGDGVLAYFGYPRANEDDAANAVTAGLAIIEAIGRIKVPQETPLHVRVGIATGLVVVSDRVSLRNKRSSQIVGEMPNLAARLQSVARPGTVVIADSTRRVTRGAFTYRDLGAVTLKGFKEPVQAWEIGQPNADESRYRARLQGEPLPFVGRKREFEALVERWARARDGSGQVVHLIGEAGIGKSRLTETLQEYIGADPHVRIRWFCSPQHKESAFHPAIDQLQRAASIDRNDPVATRIAKLRRLIGESGNTDETALGALAGLLSIPLDRPSPVDVMTPEKRKQVTLQALIDQFRKLNDSGPMLMIVEDAHWIDATSLELLQLTVESVDTLRNLMIVTARPEFKPRWTELPYVSTMSLGRLDPDSSEELCEEAAGSALPDSLKQQILERSDGIPLFVLELTRNVVETLQSGGRELSDRRADGKTVIPLSLHDSLVARLDRLGAARQTANIGAAIGRRFDYDLISAVAATSEAEVRGDLRQLTRAGLLSQSGVPPDSTYLFRHALIRDAAYDSMLRADRQALHSRIGETLLARFPEQAEAEPEIVAYHLSRGKNELEAVPHWEKSGQRAASRAAHSDAAARYRAGLEIIGRQIEGLARAQAELPLLVHLAISLASSRGYSHPEILGVLTRARDICDMLGNVSALFPVLRGLSVFSIVRNDLVAAEELGKKCLAIGEETGHAPFLIEAHHQLGYVYGGRGELAKARFHLERCVELYDESETNLELVPHEQDPRMSALCELATVLQLIGDADAAEAAHRRYLDLAHRLGGPYDLAYALTFAASFSNLTGNYQEAKKQAEEAIELSRTHGFGLWELSATIEAGVALAGLGRSQEAIAILEPGLAKWEAIGAYGFVCLRMGWLALGYADCGRLDQALTTIDQAIRQADEVDDKIDLSRLHRIRADILEKSPSRDRAEIERELREAIVIAQKQGAGTLEAAAQARLLELFPQFASESLRPETLLKDPAGAEPTS